MMIENESKFSKEKDDFFFDEEIEENEKKPEKVIDPIIKPKDPMVLWQMYEKERICLL